MRRESDGEEESIGTAIFERRGSRARGESEGYMTQPSFAVGVVVSGVGRGASSKRTRR